MRKGSKGNFRLSGFTKIKNNGGIEMLKREKLIAELRKEINTLLLEVAICKHAIYNANQTHLSRQKAEEYWRGAISRWEHGKKFFPSIFTDENFNRCGFAPLVIK